MRPILSHLALTLLTLLLAAPAHALQPLDGFDALSEAGTAPIDTALRFDAGTRTSLRTLDRRAEALLRDLFQGDDAALRHALPHGRRERGAADISRLLDVMTAGHGAVQQFTVLGTVHHGSEHAWTLVQVGFARGAEVLRLTWCDGMLLTVQRTAPPFVVDPSN